MATTVILRAGMGETEADNPLDAPPPVDDVMVTVDKPPAVEVTLKTIVAQLLPQAEWHVHVPGVVVHIQQVCTHEMATERSAQPVTRLGLHGNVPPLLVVAESEGIVTKGKVERPFAGDPIFKSEIGRDGGPPYCIGLHGHILCYTVNREKQKQSHAARYRQPPFLTDNGKNT